MPDSDTDTTSLADQPWSPTDPYGRTKDPMQLRSERAQVFDELNRMNAEAGDRSFTATKQVAWDILSRRMDLMNQAITDTEGTEAREKREFADYITRGSSPENTYLKADQSLHERAIRSGKFTVEDEHLSLGKFCRGLATGEWTDADLERRAAQEGTIAAGGALVPLPLSSRIIDAARARAVCLRAGVQTYPMTSATERFARNTGGTGDWSLAWRSESGSVNFSDAIFEQGTATAHSLSAGIKASRELLMDANNFAAVATTAMAQIFANKIDYGILRSAGTANDPTGILHQSGVGGTTIAGSTGALSGYRDLMTGISTLRGSNFEPTGVIYSPRTVTGVHNMSNSFGNPLEPPQDVAKLPEYWTSTIPTNLTVGAASGNGSEVYLADFTQAVLCVREQLEVFTLMERFADTGEVGLIFHMRADVFLEHAAAFYVIQGVTT